MNLITAPVGAGLGYFSYNLNKHIKNNSVEYYEPLNEYFVYDDINNTRTIQEYNGDDFFDTVYLVSCGGDININYFKLIGFIHLYFRPITLPKVLMQLQRYERDHILSEFINIDKFKKIIDICNKIDIPVCMVALAYLKQCDEVCEDDFIKFINDGLNEFNNFRKNKLPYYDNEDLSKFNCNNIVILNYSKMIQNEEHHDFIVYNDFVDYNLKLVNIIKRFSKILNNDLERHIPECINKLTGN